MTHWARLKPRITSSHGLFSMGFLGSAGKLPPLFGGRDFKRRLFFLRSLQLIASSDLKMDGRKTIVSFWDGLFSWTLAVSFGEGRWSGGKRVYEPLVRGWMKVCCAQVFGMPHPLDVFSWWFFTDWIPWDSSPSNYHFGRIFLELVPSIKRLNPREKKDITKFKNLMIAWPCVAGVKE